MLRRSTVLYLVFGLATNALNVRNNNNNNLVYTFRFLPFYVSFEMSLFQSVCVSVCLFSSHLFWTSSSLDVPAGVSQEERKAHTGFLIHLPSAVHAFTFLARRIQPFFSLFNREAVVGHIQFYFIFSEKKSQLPGFELTSQRVRRLRGYQLSYRSDRIFFSLLCCSMKYVARFSLLDVVFLPRDHELDFFTSYLRI